jgi:membrane fusion protein (multidrug efflux system)
MPDGNSAESAGKSLHEPPPSAPTLEADARIAQAPNEKQPQKRPLWMWIAGGAFILLALYEAIPWAINAFRTESTDDAYVNGHVTFVAARVPGQVVRVLVDDNNRLQKGALLVQLDKEPYQVKVDIAQAALSVAQADLVTAQAKVRSLEGLARSQRFDLANAMHNLNNQVADLHSKVDALQAANATLVKTRADYARQQQLYQQQVISKQEFDSFQEAFSVAQAQEQKAQHDVGAVRAELGLAATSKNGDELSGIPANLDQTYSAVKVAQARLMQTASELGVLHSFNQSPDEMLAAFYKRDPSGNIDAIFDQISKNAPDTKQAEAKLIAAQANLRQAELNLSYCDVVAKFDGVVTRRNVNPGDEVLAGQGLMALRSLTDIWVDANFKETQLANLRIGQPVEIDVDMYGSHRRFQGRVSGFTMGTGSTLALLPAENATGNFVKVVQRLPVRIELTNYDPDVAPLFIGLSVTPHVYIREAPTGPNAGKMLQASVSATGPVSAPGGQ